MDVVAREEEEEAASWIAASPPPVVLTQVRLWRRKFTFALLTSIWHIMGTWFILPVPVCRKTPSFSASLVLFPSINIHFLSAWCDYRRILRKHKGAYSKT